MLLKETSVFFHGRNTFPIIAVADLDGVAALSWDDVGAARRVGCFKFSIFGWDSPLG